MRKIYYIETTRNGKVFNKTEICDYVLGKDYIDDLLFTRDGEEVNYYEDVAGMMDDLDLFLKKGNHNHCEEYEEDNHLGTKKNVYLEYWYTDVLGYYEDRYIGLMIK